MLYFVLSGGDIVISGERIKNIRKMRDITQKELGMAVGFEEATADIRIAQYESDNRTPKANLLSAIAKKLRVSPYALAEPQIETKLSLLHTLFAIEDLYDLDIREQGGEIGFFFSQQDRSIDKALETWLEKKQAFERGELSREDYDLFRYSFTDAEDKKPNVSKRIKEKKPQIKEAPQTQKDEYWLL